MTLSLTNADISLENSFKTSSNLFDSIWQQIRHEYSSASYVLGDDLISVFIDVLTAGLNRRGEYDSLFEQVRTFAAYLSKSWKICHPLIIEDKVTSCTSKPSRQETQASNHPAPPISNSPNSSLFHYFSPTVDLELVADSKYYTREPHADIEKFIRDQAENKYYNDQLALNFQVVCMDVCHLRRLFITADGYLGIGPQATRPGDVVCVLLGGSTPFVLRKMECSDMQRNGMIAIPEHVSIEGVLYRLIGECYIRDLMIGEAVHQSLRPAFPMTEFVLV